MCARLPSNKFIKENKMERVHQSQDLNPNVSRTCQIACKLEWTEESDKHDIDIVLRRESGKFESNKYSTNLIANVMGNKVESYAEKKQLTHSNKAKNATAVKVLSLEISSNMEHENERPIEKPKQRRSTPNRMPVSSSQMALIVDLMANNQKVLGGSLSTKCRHIPSAVAPWSRCSRRLNRLPGPNLAPDIWRNVWMRTKSVVESKMAAGRRCIGAVPSHLRLGKLELRVANILKLEQKTRQYKLNDELVLQVKKDSKQCEKDLPNIPRASAVRECRACSNIVNLVHIFSPHDGRSIQRDMFQCCNILAKQNDGLPAWLCISCLALLRGAVSFRDKCHATQKRLCRDNRRHIQELPRIKRFDLPKIDERSVKIEVDISNVEENFEQNYLVESNATAIEELTIRKVEPVDQEAQLQSSSEPRLEEWNANSIEEQPLQGGHDWWDEYASHVCEYCDRPLRSRMRYREHMSGACVARLPPPRPPPPPRGAPKQWPRVVCHLCGEFRAAMTFKCHIASKHSEDGDGFRFKCKSCPYSSRTRGHMVTHVKTVHLGLKPHMCALCGMKFSNTSNLKWHTAKNHAAPTPFQCPQCDAILSSKRYLSRHLRGVHENKPCECDVCGNTYKSRKHMMKHKRKVHHINTGIPYPQLGKASCFKQENLNKKTGYLRNYRSITHI